MKPPRPELITFDIFGTVVDWRRGMQESVKRVGEPLTDAEFDVIVDVQGAEEAYPWRSYRDITADSLILWAGVSPSDAAGIGAEVGRWPLFADSAEGLRQLMKIAPCAATTNSDVAHGEQVQEQLGFRLSHWLCAEETRCYKPSLKMWEAAGQKFKQKPGPEWWHVSAYADYDLVPAKRFGLTTVFIPRPHSRHGEADVTTKTLIELATLLS